MFAGVTYRVLALLPKLHLMESAKACLHIISITVTMAIGRLMGNVIMVGGFKGNIWAGEAKDATAAFFFDERSNEKQREALQMIFTGKAGGFAAEFAKVIGDI